MTCSGPASLPSCCWTSLARRLPAGAASVVGTYRELDPVPGPALAALAARSTVLPLAGLTAAATAELVAGVVGPDRAQFIAADLHRRTAGNPFFAQQVAWLLKEGRAGVPPGAQEALAQRFAGLPGGCAAALSAAAVAGPRFGRRAGRRPDRRARSGRD